MAANGAGFSDRLLNPDEIVGVFDAAFGCSDFDARRVLVVIPDGTRSCPMDLAFRLLYERLAPRVAALDFLVALGTHPAMTDEQIYARVGISAAAHRSQFPKARFFNHEWKNPNALARLGTIPGSEIAAISDGLFEMDVPITCNRMVQDHDIVLVVGPVFPHEVVGFSGGNKYLFPGVAGQEIIDFFHWLGAVITNYQIIGTKFTPVRRVVDRAARMVTAERRALCMVVKGEGLSGLYYGSPEDAWSAAADLSAEVHIRYTGRAYHTILARAPRMYDDLWTGGKCMYKTEPVIADGGRVIIYAPHITEISSVHGAVLETVGYHVRDFFLKQWDRYRHYPWGVLAHSTHVKGMGTYENGVESPRVDVVLATGIPEPICRQVNLGYLDPAGVNVREYEGREDEGVLYLPKAGEILYRMDKLT